MAKGMTFPLECYSKGIETLIHFSNPHNGIDILNLRTMTPSMVGLMRPCAFGGGKLLSLQWIKYIKAQDSSIFHWPCSRRQVPKTYIQSSMDNLAKSCMVLWGIVHGSRLRNALFRVKGMILLSRHHSSSAKTPTHFSKPNNGVNILNHMTMTPSRSNMSLDKVIFVALDGYNIPLGTKGPSPLP